VRLSWNLKIEENRSRQRKVPITLYSVAVADTLLQQSEVARRWDTDAPLHEGRGVFSSAWNTLRGALYGNGIEKSLTELEGKLALLDRIINSHVAERAAARQAEEAPELAAAEAAAAN
jgi:hypothetical protein